MLRRILTFHRRMQSRLNPDVLVSLIFAVVAFIFGVAAAGMLMAVVLVRAAFRGAPPQQDSEATLPGVIAAESNEGLRSPSPTPGADAASRAATAAANPAAGANSR